MLAHRSRALEFMDRSGLDGLVATSPANVLYFTGYFCWLDSLLKEYMIRPGAGSGPAAPAYAVFPRQGNPALGISVSLAPNAADLQACDVFTFGEPLWDGAPPGGVRSGLGERFWRLADASRRRPTPLDTLIEALRSRGLTRTRIGIETETLPVEVREALFSRLPAAEWKDCTNLIRLIRSVKSPEEIELLRQAAQVSETAARQCLRAAKPGTAVQDLVQEYRRHIAAAGADFDHFAYGAEGVGMAIDTEHRLREHEMLFLDFGCNFRHYFSDTGLTLAMGGPAQPLLDKYHTLRDCIGAGASALRPGAKASAAPAAMWQVLAERGIRSAFPHGHGLGLELRDYPILVQDNALRIRDECIDVPSDLPLEAGMVLNLEATILMPGVGSLEIEQTFLVTAGGCELLVPQNRSEPFQCVAS